LYDAGHEVAGADVVPAAGPLAPADIAVIRDALADAYASRWHRDEPGNRQAAAYTALLDRLA
jgi:hypothetical protein